MAAPGEDATLHAMDAPYRHIACCVDRSGAALGVLRVGRKLRELGPGRLTLVHVTPWGLMFGGYPGVEPEDPETLAADAKTWLDEMVTAHPGSEGVLLNGYPPAVTCEWAHGADVDLLVAASSRGVVDRVLLGSFAGYLVRHAPCGIILTRPTHHHGEEAGGKHATSEAGGG
jgi:nucleotide-binding universal stress UspA family protein